MKKIFFLRLQVLLLFTATVYGFNVTDSSNCTNKNLILPPNVDFSFNNDNSCSGTLITFTAIVSGAAPFTYKWDFGDGNTFTGNNPSHAFTTLGCGSQNFSVKLTVTDANGEVNSRTKVISVKQKPDLKFVNLNAPSVPVPLLKNAVIIIQIPIILLKLEIIPGQPCVFHLIVLIGEMVV